LIRCAQDSVPRLRYGVTDGGIDDTERQNRYHSALNLRHRSKPHTPRLTQPPSMPPYMTGLDKCSLGRTSRMSLPQHLKPPFGPPQELTTGNGCAIASPDRFFCSGPYGVYGRGYQEM